MFEHIWDEIGQKHNAVGWHVLVRCDPPSQFTRSGLLILPNSLNQFYSKLAHKYLVKATVLDATPETGLKIEDRIMFQRLFFRRIMEMKDKSVVGTIEFRDVWGTMPDGECDIEIL